MPEVRINLSTTGAYTEPVRVGAAAQVAYQVTSDASFSWASAVVTMQWTVDEDESSWIDYPTAQFGVTTATRGRPRLSIAGVRAIRWRCSTSETGADPAAVLDYLLT